MQEAARVKEEFEYATKVHQAIFEAADELEYSKEARRRTCAENFYKTYVSIRTNDGIIDQVHLMPLVMSSDVVYTLARSNHWSFASTKRINLVDFTSMDVSYFFQLLTSDVPIDDIAMTQIVPCTLLSHFLQCTSILSVLTDKIQQSIDSKNCASICTLADHLDLPSLFESGLSHMLSSLDDIRDHELWDDIPRSLQWQIINMRDAVQSSIVGLSGSKVCFSSSNEFLAIFADSIYEQRERLREAKERQKEIVRERIDREKRLYSGVDVAMDLDLEGRRSRRILRNVYLELDPNGGSVKDAKNKIARQEQRLRILEAFYMEQKEIFTDVDVKSGT